MIRVWFIKYPNSYAGQIGCISFDILHFNRWRWPTKYNRKHCPNIMIWINDYHK